MSRGRRLLVTGTVALVLAFAALGLPVHSGSVDCGSVLTPRAGSATTDCRDYQRVLLGSGAVLLVAGIVLVGVGWHVSRPDDDEQQEEETQ